MKNGIHIKNKDMIGQVLGIFTVLKRVEKPLNLKGTDSYWLCRCKCSKEKIISKQFLLNGRPKCDNCNQVNKNENSRIYTIWYGMINRCTNPNIHNYDRYGGRGIKVCDEWMNDFDSFKKWTMNNGYEEDLTIDRIDTDGDYEPSNCKWSTVLEQNKNKSSTIKMMIDNVEYDCLKDVAKAYNIKYKTIHERYNRGLRDEELVKQFK